jgi:hypothetical protein
MGACSSSPQTIHKRSHAHGHNASTSDNVAGVDAAADSQFDSSIAEVDLREQLARLERENAELKKQNRHLRAFSVTNITLYEPSYSRELPAEADLHGGLCITATPLERAAFLKTEWIPFIKNLRLEALQVQTRTLSDFSIEERMPPQKVILELTERCHMLTEKWYGPGRSNVSCMYEFLMECSDNSGITAYTFDQIPFKRSHDHYCRVLDGRMRLQLYTLAKQNEEPAMDDEIIEAGHLPQDTGESPIDNTVLPNAMTPLQARVLIAGGRIKSMLLSKVISKQTDYLRKLGGIIDENLFRSSKPRVQHVLRDLYERHNNTAPDDQSELDALGIDAENVSFQTLMQRGAVIQSWGQISSKDQKRVHNYIVSSLREVSDSGTPSNAAADAADEKTQLRITVDDDDDDDNDDDDNNGGAAAAAASSTGNNIGAIVGVDEYATPPQTGTHSRRASNSSVDPGDDASAISVAHSINSMMSPTRLRVEQARAMVLEMEQDAHDDDTTTVMDTEEAQQIERVMSRAKSQCLQDDEMPVPFALAPEDDDSDVSVGALVDPPNDVPPSEKHQLPRRDSSSSSIAGELKEFMEWYKKNPGRIYKNDKALHKKLVVLGMWTKELAVMKRSTVEAASYIRYIPFRWERQVPLITMNEDGSEEELRAAGSVEWSRFRKNHFPYANSHGLGISTGGIVEGNKAHGSLAYELGTLMPSDAEAKLPNWFATDIEKILVEATVLNPSGGQMNLLPGEEFHEVGQNPAAGSSIRKTQHTQIARSTIEEWPVLLKRHEPTWCQPIRAYIDVVQVGDEVDAFYLKLRTQHPRDVGLVEFLQDLRLTLMRQFGGRAIDFWVSVFPEGRARSRWFAVIFAPLAMVEVVQRKPVWIQRNPDTGKTQHDYNLPVGALDTASGKGSIVAYSEQAIQDGLGGKTVMGSLFDYARKPGSRKAVSSFLLDRTGFIDHHQLPVAVLPRQEFVFDQAKTPVFTPCVKQTNRLDSLDLDKTNL